MPKNHACDEKLSKCTIELSFCKTIKFLRRRRIIVWVKMEHGGNQFLIRYYKLISSRNYLGLHIAGNFLSF